MFLVVKKKVVCLIGAILLVIIVGCVAMGMSSRAIETASKRLIPIYSVDNTEGKVALTFDASWGSDKTRKIMNLLEDNGYRGTFFLTGFWVDENEELTKEIFSRGHLVGNHSENHKHLSEVKKEVLKEEIDGVSTKIEKLTGETTKYFRAPFGEYDNRLISALNERNIYCIQWSIDSLDWKGISGKEISDRVVSRVKSGDIILFHNNSDHVLDALPLIILALKNKNLTAVRVDELIYKDNYYIDNSGKQIRN